MTARPGLVTDAQIERMLRGRAAAPDASLLTAVLAQVEAAPQDRRWLRRASAELHWSVPTGSRRLLAFALLALLLAAVAGAIAIGFRPPRPLPPSWQRS